MSSLSNKHILLGVTGGIAAYKSADCVRRLREAGAVVRVVMTQAAKEFITPLTMQAVSGQPIHDDLLDTKAEAAMGHIELARWADLILVAPASADFIAQLVHGHARDLLTTLCLATNAKIALAPAMNQQMWHAEVTQENLSLLKKREIIIFGPGEGSQACGDVGLGRMLESSDLVQLASKLFTTGELASVRVLITAGPTIEPIDPVRFISNHSSGKMGYALAEAAVEAGAFVSMVSGPVALKSPEGVQVISVLTAEEMYEAVMTKSATTNIFIATAAVSDYRCVESQKEKLAKEQAEKMTLQLIRNPDILAEVASSEPKPFCVGFAAETSHVIANAKEKLRRKNLDLIVANQVGLPDRGFESDDNACYLLWPQGQQDFALMSKHQLARELIHYIASHYHAKYSIKNS